MTLKGYFEPGLAVLCDQLVPEKLPESFSKDFPGRSFVISVCGFFVSYQILFTTTNAVEMSRFHNSPIYVEHPLFLQMHNCLHEKTAKNPFLTKIKTSFN